MISVYNIVKNCFYNITFYLFFTRTSVFPVLYLLLVTTFHAVPIHLGLTPLRIIHPDSYHLFIPFCFCVFNLISFFLCCFVNPGVVKAENVSKYKNQFVYDNLMYKENCICHTCTFIKPARSKHCVVMDQCISKFDHYCVWVANCIGGNNHRFFILFLTSLLLMVANGINSLLRVLSCLADITKVWLLVKHKSALFEGASGSWELFFNRHLLFSKVMLIRHTTLTIMFLACVVLAIVLAAFLAFHCYLAASNQTTNEWYKRRILRKELQRLLTTAERQQYKEVNRLAVQGHFYSAGLVNNLLQTCLPHRVPGRDGESDEGSGWSEVVRSPVWKVLMSRRAGEKAE